MLKKCKICKRKFNAIKSTITCSINCSKLNEKLWEKQHRKEKIKYMKIWEHKHKLHRKKYYKYYYKKNKKILNIKRHLSYLKNKKRELMLNKLWIKNNMKLRRKQKQKYYKEHAKQINFKVLVNLRSRIYSVLKGIYKSKKTIDLLGCSIEKLKQHLESNFKLGMSWDNYGTGWKGKGMQEWHIDHKIPCSSFDLSKPSEQRKCFHYTNLQPLWARENISKKDKIL
jgi:predicted RNase H-like nuclease (RuvC/YqgF family)